LARTAAALLFLALYLPAASLVGLSVAHLMRSPDVASAAPDAAAV
jgi:hypothetical protein